MMKQLVAKQLVHVYYLEELNKQVASSKAKISTPSVSVNHSPEYQRKKNNYKLLVTCAVLGSEMSNSRSQNFSVIQVFVINGKDIRGIVGYKTSGRQQRNDNVPLTVRYKGPLTNFLYERVHLYLYAFTN